MITLIALLHFHPNYLLAYFVNKTKTRVAVNICTYSKYKIYWIFFPYSPKFWQHFISFVFVVKVPYFSIFLFLFHMNFFPSTYEYTLEQFVEKKVIEKEHFMCKTEKQKQKINFVVL